MGTRNGFSHHAGKPVPRCDKYRSVLSYLFSRMTLVPKQLWRYVLEALWVALEQEYAAVVPVGRPAPDDVSEEHSFQLTLPFHQWQGGALAASPLVRYSQQADFAL